MQAASTNGFSGKGAAFRTSLDEEGVVVLCMKSAYANSMTFTTPLTRRRSHWRSDDIVEGVVDDAVSDVGLWLKPTVQSIQILPNTHSLHFNYQLWLWISLDLLLPHRTISLYPRCKDDWIMTTIRDCNSLIFILGASLSVPRFTCRYLSRNHPRCTRL